MAQEVRLKLTADDKASRVIKGTSTELKGATAQTTLLGGAMNIVKAAMLKVKAVSKMLFGSIRAGLISTGIGAFVVVIGSLVAYFTQTKKGAELLEQAFAGIGAAVAVITDRISKIGGAIAKVFSGDFKGAAEDVKGALSGIGEEIVAEAKAASRLKGELQDIADATREFKVEKALTNQEIQKALLLAEDETKSNEERLQGLKDALALEEETTAKELELQARKVAAIEEEVGLGESLAEDLDRLNSEKIKLIELETASIRMKKKVVTQVNTFEKQIATEEAARVKAKAAEQKEIDKAEAKEAEVKETRIATAAERLRLLRQENSLLEIEDAHLKALALLEVQQQAEMASASLMENSEAIKEEIEKKYAKKTLKLIKNQADKEKKLETAKITAKQDLNDATLAGVANLAGALGKLAGDSKGLAVAEATISTYLGATKALAAGAGTPVGYINAAAIIATGLANVKTILSTKVEGEKGGSGGVPSGGVPSMGGSIAAGVPASIGLGDIVGSLESQSSTPMQAYVIGQDVTDSQEAQTYINNQRTL